VGSSPICVALRRRTWNRRSSRNASISRFVPNGRVAILIGLFHSLLDQREPNRRVSRPREKFSRGAAGDRLVSPLRSMTRNRIDALRTTGPLQNNRPNCSRSFAPARRIQTQPGHQEARRVVRFIKVTIAHFHQDQTLHCEPNERITHLPDTEGKSRATDRIRTLCCLPLRVNEKHQKDGSVPRLSQIVTRFHRDCPSIPD